MDSIMCAVGMKWTQLNDDWYFTVEFARQKLSNYCAEVTLTTGILLNSEFSIEPCERFCSFRKWEKGLNINPQDMTSHTAKYHKALEQNVANKYCAKHRRISGIQHEKIPGTNSFPCMKNSQFVQSSFNEYDMSCEDEEYTTPKWMAKKAHRWSNRTAHILSAARRCLNSPPESPKQWEHVNANVNNYHSNPRGISRILWIPDIIDWWQQQQETHWKCTNLCNIAAIILSNIPQDVRVQARHSPVRDVIGWRQSKSTGETHLENFVLRQLLKPLTDWWQAPTLHCIPPKLKTTWNWK